MLTLDCALKRQRWKPRHAQSPAFNTIADLSVMPAAGIFFPARRSVESNPQATQINIILTIPDDNGNDIRIYQQVLQDSP
jgi:hypothetical protein